LLVDAGAALAAAIISCRRASQADKATQPATGASHNIAMPPKPMPADAASAASHPLAASPPR